MQFDIDFIIDKPVVFRLILFTIVFTGILVCGYGMDLNHQKSLYQHALKQQQQLNDTVASKQKILLLLAAYQEDKKKIDPKLKKIIDRLPNNNETPSVVEFISRQAANHNLALSNLELGQEHKNSHYSEIPMEVSLSGDYKQIANFLHYEIEN